MKYHVIIAPDLDAEDFVKGEEVYGVLMGGRWFDWPSNCVRAARNVADTMATQTAVLDSDGNLFAGPFGRSEGRKVARRKK